MDKQQWSSYQTFGDLLRFLRQRERLSQRDLAAADTLLPADIKVDKIDLVERAQTEWHFLVLSHKLDMQYHSELNDMKERIVKLEAYDQNIWDELKGFWDKVREQVTNRNLMREQQVAAKSATEAGREYLSRSEIREQMRRTLDCLANLHPRQARHQVLPAIDGLW